MARILKTDRYQKGEIAGTYDSAEGFSDSFISVHVT